MSDNYRSGSEISGSEISGSENLPGSEISGSEISGSENLPGSENFNGLVNPLQSFTSLPTGGEKLSSTARRIKNIPQRHYTGLPGRSAAGVCGVSKADRVTLDPAKVTCKRCLTWLGASL